MDDLARFCCLNSGCRLYGQRAKPPEETNRSVLTHLHEGCGVRQTARLTRVNRGGPSIVTSKGGTAGRGRKQKPRARQ